jgi:hypothetical protein
VRSSSLILVSRVFGGSSGVLQNSCFPTYVGGMRRGNWSPEKLLCIWSQRLQTSGDSSFLLSHGLAVMNRERM